MRNFILGAVALTLAAVQAEHGRYALVTQAPALVPRQGQVCDTPDGTVCADGNGCCPRGIQCAYKGITPICQKPCGAGDEECGGACCSAGHACPTAATALCGPLTGGGGGGGGFTVVPMPTFVSPTFSGLASHQTDEASASEQTLAAAASSTTSSTRSASPTTEFTDTENSSTADDSPAATETGSTGSGSSGSESNGSGSSVGGSRSNAESLDRGFSAGVLGFIVIAIRMLI